MIFLSLNRIYGIIIALCKYIDCLVVLVSGVLDDHFKRIPHITKCDDTLKNPHWSITIRAECRLKNSRLGRKPANKLKIYSKMFQQSLAVNDPVFLANFFFKCLNLFIIFFPWKRVWSSMSSYMFVISLLYAFYVTLHLINLEFPSSKNDVSQVWLKLTLLFWRRFSNVNNLCSPLR